MRQNFNKHERNKNIINNTEEVDSIDTISLIKRVWKERILVFKVACTSFLLGCIVALLSPVIYESQTTFIPQTSDQDSSRKGLGSLASLAGIKLNENSSSIDNYISPLLYSKIIDSEEFSVNLLTEELFFLDGSRKTVKEYLLEESNGFDLIGFIKKYTIDLFSKKNNKTSDYNNFDNDYNFITDQDFQLIQSFKNKFSIEANKREGYIKVIATDKNAFISSQLVKIITINLQSRIISLRTNKIKEQLDYSTEQYFKKKDEFEILQIKLAEFRDSNKNISTAVFLSELQMLESEYLLQQSILMSLANEYNSNKIKLNKDTPIFSVLDEVSVPNKRSEPKRKQIVLIYMLVGISMSIIFIWFKDTFKAILQKIKEN